MGRIFNTFRPTEEGKVNTRVCYWISAEYSADTQNGLLNKSIVVVAYLGHV